MVLEVTPFTSHNILTFILKNYTTIAVLTSLTVVTEFVGVNNMFNVPVVIEESNTDSETNANTMNELLVSINNNTDENNENDNIFSLQKG